MPSAKIVTFPAQPQRQRLRLPDGVSITIPFTSEERAVIHQHLQERTPELIADIDDPRVQDIIERYLEYVWQTCAEAKVALVKNCAGFFIAIASLHIHSYYALALPHLHSGFIPGLA